MRPPKDIDEYLAKLPQPARTALTRQRKIIHSAAPQATEVISYQIPAFRQARMLVGFGATPKHCALYMMSGTLLARYAQELKRDDVSEGTIRFPPAAPLPAALVKKIVKARIAEKRRGEGKMRAWVALLFLFAVSAAQAQNTPVGLWQTIDDTTYQEKSLVRITDASGVLSGRIEKLLHPSHPDPVCEKCSDERHGKPITGLTIIAGLRQHGDVWDGGKILDPENGKVYTVRLKPLDGGKQLEVRGYIGPFFRNQRWIRVQ